jgi:KDO2-lipid IV(A) lauroyltransferase
MLNKNNFKKIRYILESPLAMLGIFFFRSLSIKNASNFSALIAKLIGNKIAVNKLAIANISKALPQFNDDQKQQIILDMWDNLGRIVGEFPHICKLSGEELKKFIEIDENTKINLDNLIKLNKGGIIFSAHFGNWEVGPKFLQNYGLKVHTLYRPLNNPIIEKITAKLRGVPLIEKGSAGSRELINALKNREYVIIMADQKITDGEPIQFFHDKAITSTAIAKMAVKYNVPLIPGCIFRIDKKFKFKLIIEKPLDYLPNKIDNISISNLTLKINQTIENWIKISPHQWFWVHNRWKK